MSDKNTALLGIHPIHGDEDAVLDALNAKGFGRPVPARSGTIGPTAMPPSDPPPSEDYAPNSWPNSGFRNSGRRGR